MPVKNDMASTKVMRTDVHVATVFLLSEISTLLEKESAQCKQHAYTYEGVWHQ
jgi:hypothetical protein